MSEIYGEQWDTDCTPPAGPSAWNLASPLATTASGPTPISSPNMLFLPAGNPDATPATYDAEDGNAGNCQLTGTFQFYGSSGLGNLAFSLLGRGSSFPISYVTSKFYEVRLNSDTLSLNKWSGGSYTILGSTFPTCTYNTWYEITMVIDGSSSTSFSITLQRLTDDYWWDGSTWISAPSVAFTYTDSSSPITGQGYWGLSAASAVSSTGSPVYMDDWTLSTYGSAPVPLSGTPCFPDRAPRPPAAAPSAYNAISYPPAANVFPAIPGQPVWPGVALGPPRAAPSAYSPPVHPALPDVHQPPGSPSWPGQIVPLRPRPDYTVSVAQAQPDAHMPAASPVYPAIAPPPRRALDSTVVDYQEPPPPALPTTTVPVWPTTAPGPRRALDSTIIVVQAQPDAVIPPGVIVYQDRISWPGYAPRAVPTAYLVDNPGPGNVIPPMIAPGIFPVWPASAPGPLRAGPDAYRGMLSSLAQPDALQPAGRPVFPERSLSQPRATPDAFRAMFAGRGPDGSTSANVSQPAVAPGPQRASNTSYTVIVAPHIADRLEPTGSPSWPSRADAPQRAASRAYQAWQGSPFESPIPKEIGTMYFPDRAPLALRATPDAYRGLLSGPVHADGQMPARGYFPGNAPGPQRSAAAAYIAIVHPAIPDAHQPIGSPSVPAIAPGAARAANRAYDGLVSRIAQPDLKIPPGTVAVSDPRREALRTAASAYLGSISRQAQADTHQPSGAVVFPSRAEASARSSPTAYDHVNRPPLPQTFNVAVATTLNVQAFVGWGAVYLLNVSSGLGVSAYIPTSLGRYRLGDQVNVQFLPTIIPTSAPTMTVSEIGGSFSESMPLWTWDSATFQADVLLGVGFPVGTFQCACYFVQANGTGQLLTQQFTVVAGGDPGSNVIATYVHEGATRRIVIGQLRSGGLVSGADPYLE